MPRVSAVIRTRGRPDLVPRAVRSALDQTVTDLEVIVVVDGPDPGTTKSLASIPDDRLRLVMLPENAGLGGAMNAGVREARGRWIAFLDDDDEWLPSKLERQLAVAERSARRFPMVACRLLARSEAGDLLWPLRTPDPAEPLSEYLFCQRGLRGGEGVLLPSTLLVPRELLIAVPFREDLAVHDDADWILRAAATHGVRPEFVPGPEPLAIWNMQEGRPRMGTSSPWRSALGWIRESRALVTPRAYAGYLLTSASLTAARGRHGSAFWVLLLEAFRRGRPGPADLGAHLAIWLVPKALRNRLVVSFRGRSA